MKAFIITVDTEGDNLWQYTKGQKITTENAHFIPRFQELCDIFEYKPTYLTNYEMALSDYFVETAKEWIKVDHAEIGVHLHAWNNPPHYPLNGPYDYNPYLIEYPVKQRETKFKEIYNLIKDRFGIIPFSHRAGRWAMDIDYFKLLKQFNIKVDCSITPKVDWSNNVGITRGGSDYSLADSNPSWIEGILEVPMTIRKLHHWSEGSIKHRVKTLIKGDIVWLRPATQSLSMMKTLIDIVSKERDTDYLEFMIHSSELMPGGSPYFKTKQSVDELYTVMSNIFDYAKGLGFSGYTMNDYYEEKVSK